MTSIYRRATPSQVRMFRAIEGAGKNVSDAHPNWRYDPTMIRSLAKRATGTLTSQWEDVLAARDARRQTREPSDLIRGDSRCGNSPAYQLAALPGRSLITRSVRLYLNKRIRLKIGRMAREAKLSGNTVRHATIVDVLRELAKIIPKPEAIG